MIPVEVAYARPDQQFLYSLEVLPGANIQDAITLSGLLDYCPEIDLEQQKIGIFGQVLPLSQPLQAGDRVEIYRPLHKDPKTARQLRVKLQKGGNPGNTALINH